MFFFESQRRHFSRSSAGKDDLVCLRVGLSSIDSRGTLVAGPPPSSSSSRQWRDISNLPGSQGSLSKVESNTSMIRKVQKEHVPETESDCKTRSNFRALFYRVSRAFGCDQNVHVALVTRGARRSTRNLPYVTITHSYVLAFFPTRFSFTFSKPLLQKLFVHGWGPVVQWLVQRFRSERLRVRSRRSATFTPSAHVRRQSLPVWPPTLNNYLYLLPFTRRYQHDSVLEPFPHFGRQIKRYQ